MMAKLHYMLHCLLIGLCVYLFLAKSAEYSKGYNDGRIEVATDIYENRPVSVETETGFTINLNVQEIFQPIYDGKNATCEMCHQNVSVRFSDASVYSSALKKFVKGGD